MDSIDRKLAKLLGVDPLLEAEKITGESYKESAGTSGLGMLLMQDNHASKEALLSLTNDTCFRNKTDEYIAKIQEEGFEQVLLENFTISTGYSGEPLPVEEHKNERFFVFWHPDGILLRFDTYGGDSVNSASFYYNIAVDNKHEFLAVRSSGTYVTYGDDGGKSVWAGNHDAREAVRFNLRRLRACGRFLPQWVEADHQHSIWLSHYGDTHGYNDADFRTRMTKVYKAIRERVERLPEHVRTALWPSLKTWYEREY